MKQGFRLTWRRAPVVGCLLAAVTALACAELEPDKTAVGHRGQELVVGARQAGVLESQPGRVWEATRMRPAPAPLPRPAICRNDAEPEAVRPTVVPRAPLSALRVPAAHKAEYKARVLAETPQADYRLPAVTAAVRQAQRRYLQQAEGLVGGDAAQEEERAALKERLLGE